MSSNIAFTGEPFTAIVEDRWGEEFECMASASMVPGACSLMVEFTDGTAMAQEVQSDGNLVSAWRAALVLCRLDYFSFAVMVESLIAVSRRTGDVQPNIASRAIERTVERIGREAYGEIMAEEVPVGVIRVLMDARGSDSALQALFDEVEAGTIGWKDLYSADVIISGSNRLSRPLLWGSLEHFLRSTDKPLSPKSKEVAEVALVQAQKFELQDSISEQMLIALAFVAGEVAEVKATAKLQEPPDVHDLGFLQQTCFEAAVVVASWVISVQDPTQAPDEDLGGEHIAPALMELIGEFFPITLD